MILSLFENKIMQIRQQNIRKKNQSVKDKNIVGFNEEDDNISIIHESQLIIIILTVYMENDIKNELDMNKIYKRGFYDLHRCTRKKNRPITSFDMENQHPNVKNNETMQMPTFGNWKNSLQLNKVMQKMLYEPRKVPLNQIGQISKQNRKVSSSRQYKHKPLFPKNNEIIKRFIKTDNQPVRYRTLDKTSNQQSNTKDMQGTIKNKRRRFKSLRNSKQILKQQLPEKYNVSSSCTKQITKHNFDSVQLAPTDLFLQIPKIKKTNAKNWFANIYNRQKANYEVILEKYGIKEKVDDSEFNEFLNQIQ